jgi:hypothetical protein
MHFDHEVRTGSGLCGFLFLFFLSNGEYWSTSQKSQDCQLPDVLCFWFLLWHVRSAVLGVCINSVYNFDFSSVWIIIKTSQLMLYSEIITVCSKIHTKHINTLWQNVPRSKHSVSVIKTSQLMLHSEIITVCSKIHTKHINTLWQNVPRSKHNPSRL